LLDPHSKSWGHVPLPPPVSAAHVHMASLVIYSIVSLISYIIELSEWRYLTDGVSSCKHISMERFRPSVVFNLH